MMMSMPSRPLLQCTYPGCTHRQKGSRCPEHNRWPGSYDRYRTIRKRLLLAHLRVHGLRCPGAEGHASHAVEAASDLTVDHILPRQRGGPDDARNLRVLCAIENSRRGARRDRMIDYRSELRLPKPAITKETEQQATPPPRMKIVKVSPPKPKAEDTTERHAK